MIETWALVVVVVEFETAKQKLAQIYRRPADSFNHYIVWEFQKEMEESEMDVMEIRMRELTRDAYFFSANLGFDEVSII